MVKDASNITKPRKTMQQAIGFNFYDVFVVGFCVIFALICFYPMWYVLVASVTPYEQFVKGGALLWPNGGVDFQYYRMIFENSSFVTSLWISASKTVLGTLLSVLVTSTMAYAVSKVYVPGMKLLNVLTVFTMFFAGGLIPTYMLYMEMKLIRTYWVMVLPYGLSITYFIIMRNYFSYSVPRELEDAARIDGCNEAQAYYKIALPLIKPVLGTVAIMSLLDIWNDYLWPLIVTSDPSKFTISLGLLKFTGSFQTTLYGPQFAGYIVTALPLVVLFFLLRRRANRIQQDYAALLAAARRMAGGDLATPVEGDMGLFDPLKDELNQVRAGFEKAVAAEVRSQNMKTELITNVSHDLKTPLTAIITYVDLLKDPALSAEDRAKYIETLDKKSQRLKRLIEDLFEVSKAATRNVAMHYAEVDLAALLKQVQYELADKTEASGIDFRWQLPEERMPLVLDGQKTCRIFENLVVNITKYGMPGTRAYITLMPQEHGAQVVFKNISATELDFSAEEITDRFVRGDRSRNTEGSGLGLAIAKSFAELQGGTFSITVDGDLFKATVTLPDTNQPEQPETLPLPAAPDADAQSAPQTGGALPAGI